MAQATSRVRIYVNGELLRSMPGAAVQLGGIDRNPVTLDSGHSDYAETPLPSSVTVNLSHVAGYDLIRIRQWRDVTLVYTTDTGDGWAIEGAWVATMGELSNGEVPVTFNGPPAQRIQV